MNNFFSSPEKQIYFKSCLLLLFIFCVANVSAQESAFGNWTSIAVEKDISDHWNIELETGNRLKDNLNQRDKTYVDAGLNWSLSFFKAGASYQLANEQKETKISYSHRISALTQLKKTVNRFDMSYRAKLQFDYKDVQSSPTGHIPSTYLRNRFKTAYDVKGIPLDPFMSYEFFWRQNSYTDTQIEKERFTMGVDYRFNKHHSVELSYILNQQKNVSNPQKAYVVSINYNIKI